MLELFEEDLTCKDVWFRYLLAAPNFLLSSLLHKLSLIHFTQILLTILAEIKEKISFSKKLASNVSLRCL